MHYQSYVIGVSAGNETFNDQFCTRADYRRVDELCLNKYTAVGNYEYIVITGQLVRWISVS